MTTTTTWQHRAACRNQDPTLFYPPDWDNPPTGRPPRNAKDPYAQARTICHRCPVITECRNYIDQWEHGHEVYGYWAHEKPKERERRRKLAALAEAV